jgi:hypothetical protein
MRYSRRATGRATLGAIGVFVAMRVSATLEMGRKGRWVQPW